MTVAIDVQQRLEVAIEVARDAGALTLETFGRSRNDVERKSDGSEVTAIDRAAERFIRERLAAEFDGDGVLGEEFEPKPSRSGWRWIIDPIDGTFSFVRGVPLYATLLGAERVDANGRPTGPVEVGVIVMPALDEVVYGATGGGAWRTQGSGDPVAARVNSVDRLEDATICVTSVDYFDKQGLSDVFSRMCAASGHTRGWSDAYAAVLLATGRCDALVEPIMNPWDSAPMQPIITEAGGRLSDWTGKETVHAPTLVASNGRVHDELLRTLRG
ncbi:MAG: inositol monophosphatase [Phycisphaerae bacterium]|nr:inositol monophosphatase [Phycisphaerae bacterium]